MPILGYFNNMWYGSASGAMDGVIPDIAIVAPAKMDIRMGAIVQGGDIEPHLKMTRALKQTLVVDALGEMISAIPKLKLKAACSVSIGAVPSASDIAQAIWQSSSSQFNASGSMGEKLNNASSAGNPWDSEVSGNNNPNTMGELIQDVKKKANMIPGLY